jgi:hypothetical protein
VLKPGPSVTVEEVLDVRIGVFFQRFGQNELEVEAEIKVVLTLN